MVMSGMSMRSHRLVSGTDLLRLDLLDLLDWTGACDQRSPRQRGDRPDSAQPVSDTDRYGVPGCKQCGIDPHESGVHLDRLCLDLVPGCRDKCMAVTN